jgi:hypothetical protein
MNLSVDGIEFEPNFLSADELAALRAETDFLFSKDTNRGPGFSVHLSQFVQELTWPLSKIKSVNLMAKAVRVLKRIDGMPGFDSRGFRLVHVAIYREHGNPQPLLWHSDGRHGSLIRAQVCIRGGARDSGAFQYIRTSQNLPQVDYLPPAGYVEQSAHLVQTCAEPNGTLYLINTLGYHNKTECIAERVSIMFDFLPESYLQENHGDICSDLVISVNDLTPEVIGYLPRLQLKLDNASPSANTADAYRFQLPFGGLRRRLNIAGRMRNALRSVRGSRA